MLLASTNCVGAVWWECIIILAPLLFFWNRIRYEREGRFRAINIILHRGCAAETDRADNFSIHFDGKSAAPRRHILIHHRLVSLVLGLNCHVYSLWVAATQRSCRRRHAFKKRVACSTKSSGYWWCAP